MTIRKKILFWFLVPSILVAAVTAAFCYYYTREVLKENIFNQLEIAANELRKHVNVFLQEKKRQIRDFAFDDFVRECTEEINQKEDRKRFYTVALNRHLVQNKKPLASDISEVFVVDFEGTIIASTDDKDIGEDVSDKYFFQEAALLNASVDYPHYDFHLKETVINISTVLLSKIEREPIGIIVNRVKFDEDVDSVRIGASDKEDYKVNHSQLLAINKTRIIDFGSDGFIRDCTEEITRREDRVKYYITALNEHLTTNKKPLDSDILTTFIVDFTGKIISSTEIGLLGKNVSGEDYFLKTMKGGSCIIDLHRSPGLEQNTFEVARLLLNKAGKKPIGIIVNRYKGDSLEKITLGSISEESDSVKVLEGFGKTGELYIVNRDNLMITKSKFIEDAILKQIVDTEGVRTAFDNGKGMLGVYKDYRGVHVLGVSRYIDDLDWVVLAKKDVSEAFAPLVRIRNFTIIMGVAGIAVIIAIAIFISREIALPIRKLIAGTRRIAEGNLKRPIDLGKMQDEIKVLGESFNLMMDKLRISNDKNVRLMMEIEKRVEDRTKELNKLHNAIEQAEEAVVITDTGGTIEYVNPAFEKITGYSATEAIGQNPRVLKSGKHPAGFYKDMWDTVVAGEIWHGDLINKKKDGTCYHEEMTITPVKKPSGTITNFVAIKRDVTLQKEAEKQLIEKSSELERINEDLKEAKVHAEVANQAKGEFLANMSHEIRTPMNGIIGMTDLLLDTKLTAEQHDCAETVRESADSLLAIINDILDFSKIEAGKMEIENIDFDLRIAVESAIDILAVKADERMLEFSSFIDPEVPSMLRGDPGRLRQVLVNLVNNALKFTKNGEVAVSVTLDGETDSHATVRFAVRDTGIGIPADRLNCLFQSFSQIDTSTTRKYGGTGLGLSISKQIAELMGGQISVESEEGKGSTFWFTAILEKQPLDQQQAPIKPGDLENLRVLVVDDNGTNRRIFRAYLRSWHCSVDEAASAAEAIRKLHNAAKGNNPFQVALIDHYMPEMDGESLGREIKAVPQLSDLILVMLTSVGKRGDAEHFRKLGFTAYLNKPVKQIQLYECLQIVTGRTRKADNGASGQIVTRYSISENLKRRVHVLLAEDNIINQKVALRILEKKLGYRVDVVTNGKEAVETLERLDYDLVLMDCQMPEMDGYEATRFIRDEGTSIRNHSIPIIAMTANAMKGDRERCLEAGMDDYVTKPIDVKKLADAIERNIPCLL